ncbi:MAG: undecaprenyl-phosphate glucose phosphotransferase [Candidatus Stahlbacteria bacterium]|nr:undecaprenyl-phosphate glucose phosphotransferase [Candidatus Stahlbacteria bacterium]
MKNNKIHIFLFLLPICWDAVLIFFSFPLAHWVRFYSNLIPITKGIPRLYPYLLISAFAVVVWIIIFYLSGLYDTKKATHFIDETFDVLKGVFMGTIILLAPIFFYRAFTFSRIVMVLGCFIGGVLVIIGKASMRYVKALLYQKGIGIRSTCIVGPIERATDIIDKLQNNTIAGFRIIGQIVDEEAKQNKVQSSEFKVQKTNNQKLIPVLGEIYDIRKIVEQNKIDMLLITFPLSQYQKVAKIILRCSGMPVEIRFIPDPYELLTSRIGYYELEGYILLGIKEFPLTYWNVLLKRVFDIGASSFLILICSPIILLISVMIKFTSDGPLFYRQKRVGKDNKIFDILKFRSMYENAEQLTGPIFASADDTRVTKIGKALRRWSIDEIPQLFNVFKGDMSLVGPRPERPEFVKKFATEIIRYFERHRVSPGVTGWAQVNGLRGDTSIKERVKYDLYYVENWSLGLDIKILLRTFRAIIVGKNAY